MSATRRIGRRRGLLSIEELHEDPAGLSLASRSGRQSRAAVFIGYWLCARLPIEWRAKGETGEVQRLLRCLQAIRIGPLKIAGQDSKRLLTQTPPELNALPAKLDLVPLFIRPPAWAEV
jgi:hypothetical protein